MLIVGGNQSAGGYEVDNSLRFDDGSSDYLTIASTTVTDDKKFTVSAWCKRTTLGGGSGDEFGIFKTISNSNNQNKNIQFGFYQDHIYFAFIDGGSVTVNKVSTASYRDVSSWYHVMLAVDSTQGTAANRNRIYVNGTEVTSFTSDTNAGADETFLSTSCNIDVGRYTNTAGSHFYFDGYLAEVVFIDGQQLDPTSFGEFDEDSGIWKPIEIDVSGLTFGNNGFYLPFENSAALGQDDSGNGNDFTVNNLTSIDQTTDTPTNNFGVLNANLPLFSSSFSEGNCKWTPTTASQFYWVNSTIGLSQGKWYMEAKLTTAAAHNGIGISSDQPADSTTYFAGSGGSGDANDAYQWNYLSSDGNIYNNASSSAYGNTYTTGDIIGMYLDLDNNKLYFAKNGTIQNSGTGVSITDPGSVPTGVYFPCVADDTSSNSSTWEVNFGNPTFTISSGNSDPNGYGNFEYDPSAGTFDGVSKNFYAINSKNLAEYG